MATPSRRGRSWRRSERPPLDTPERLSPAKRSKPLEDKTPSHDQTHVARQHSSLQQQQQHQQQHQQQAPAAPAPGNGGGAVPMAAAALLRCPLCQDALSSRIHLQLHLTHLHSVAAHCIPMLMQTTRIESPVRARRDPPVSGVRCRHRKRPLPYDAAVLVIGHPGFSGALR
ncbi:zinc finger homeobox protein 3-like [Lethenteron reissneri]|uniref:zinc finger homeobox protein 3-like n=1 Tax=Lethenteron reissneri TaxID=7753 RepID=UPI002AB710F7|nr:zinc finger homeobox protein 3-like [Lethenteron reissneri]